MQLVARILIAAVFFGLGAWVVISEFGPSSNSSRADGASRSASPTSTSSTAPRTPSGTLSPARNGAPSPINSRTPTPTASRAGTPRHTPTVTPRPPTHRPTPVPSRTTARPTPSATGTTSPPAAVPLTATIGSVRCPARTVTVEVKNVGTQAVDYTIEQDGTPTVADRIGPGTTRTSRLSLKEDDRTTLAVMWTNRTVKSASRKANCRHAAASPAPAPRHTLPHTGPDSAAVVAKVATGVAAMITGVVIFWYGGIWPRRRDELLRVKR
jgi:hypothetical protein